MTTLKFSHALLAGAAALWLIGGSAASASTIIGTEDPVSGFTGNIFESVFPGGQYIVASDGESSFDPFGAGYDTSDGLNFSAVGFVWTQAADSAWTSLGNQTWVLPANLTSFGCGVENATTCEPRGHFLSPTGWNALAIGTWDILEADGSLSDIIITDNTANGAELFFYSDPSFPAPEPVTLSLFGAGLVGAAAMRRRKRTAA